MRTAEEIKAWLESRGWYGEYKAAVEADAHNVELGVVEAYLEGRGGVMTIGGSFLWCRTTQGFKVWQNRQAEFRLWYNN